MKRRYGFLLGALLAILLLPGAMARAGVADYKFTDTYGDRIFPEGSTKQLLYAGDDDATAGFTPTVAKGDPAFTFVFAGKPYTSFSVSSNGVIGLGDARVTDYWVNQLTTESSTSIDYTLPNPPQIAPYWNDLRVPDDIEDGFSGSVEYFVNGTAPHRVLVIDYADIEISYYDHVYGFFQVRLYEGSNRIEFWYGGMNTDGWSTSASIGLATSADDFISVTPGPSGGGGALAGKSGASTQGLGNTGATVSTTAADDYVDMSTNEIPYGALYIFDPCNIQISGNEAQGGTASMADGDVLLKGVSQQVWSKGDYMPFSIYLNPDPCSDRTYTYILGGSYPGDYSITPTDGKIGADETLTPTLTFLPTALGSRPATLTVTDDNGFSRTYDLAGEATTRMKWVGNVDQGGIEPPTNGSTFLDGIKVTRLDIRDFTPLTVQNVNTNESAPGAPVSYMIDDPTGQYTLVDPNTGESVDSYSIDLMASQSSTPIIRFAPTGVGYQPATFTVTTEDETRTFNLNAYSAAAGADYFIGSEKLTSSSEIFQKDYVCTGEYIQTYEITIKNVGEGTYRITGIDAYLTDSVYGQGVPGYPLLRDKNGDPIPATDYFISDYPGVAPANANGENVFPINVPEKGERTLYINFVPQKPGKRFARIFVRSNGANFSGRDTDGVVKEGLLTVDLFGRGLGSNLSTQRDTYTPPKAITFPNTPVHGSSDQTLTFYNSGSCDLRVERQKVRIVSGDTRDFSIVGAFTNNVVDQSTDTYVVAPGDSIDLVVRFTPSRTGSRRATVLFQTNDSTIITDGLTERGAVYIDVYGIGTVGKAGLTIHDPKFAPGIIDAPTVDQPSGTVVVENPMRELVLVDSVKIVGADAAEFSMDPSHPWPVTPFGINPGDMIKLAVLYTPTPGSASGARSAELLLFIGGDTLVIPLNGYAGIRTIAVSPASLFDNTSIAVGKSAFATVMISNTGSVPLLLSNTTISGPNANDYTLSPLPRLLLAPGQTEYLEVRYRPSGQGASTATLTIASNATNGPQTVTLGGTGTRIAPGSDAQGAISGVTSSESATGTTLWQSVPNPARDIVEIRYSLTAGSDVQLKLYDQNGREVATLDRGTREAGEHIVPFRVDDMASGVYHYSLVVNGTVLTRSLTVVK